MGVARISMVPKDSDVVAVCCHSEGHGALCRMATEDGCPVSACDVNPVAAVWCGMPFPVGTELGWAAGVAEQP